MSNTVADKLARKSAKKAPAKQVRLKLAYIDVWSAAKFAFALSLCWAVVSVVAITLIYWVLVQTGVYGQVDQLFSEVVGGDITLGDYIGFGQVFGFAVVVGILNVIVGTALGAVGAVLYNLVVRVLGGFQLGFSSN